MGNYQIVRFAELPSIPCPCGEARRAFTETTAFPGTLHITEISVDAKRHYHKRLTETYYILECESGAQIELDGTLLPLEPGMAVLIPPLTRHRAIGKMRVLNIVLPKFDPSDEWFD